MKNTDFIFNLPTTLLAVLFARIVTNSFQTSSLPLTEKHIENYKKDGILIMDWQIFSSSKLEKITETLIKKVCLDFHF